jgi:hypothetical protein
LAVISGFRTIELSSNTERKTSVRESIIFIC